MSTDQILALMQDDKKSEDEAMSIIEFLGTPCQPGLQCPKFRAIQAHIEDYCHEEQLHCKENEIVKQSYDQQFWYHAPVNLKQAKENLSFDETNHHALDRLSMLLKLYKYQIISDSYELPKDPVERKKEKKRIVQLMSAHMWDNYDIE